MRIGLVGHGRMGRMIDAIAADDKKNEVVGFVGRGACERVAQLPHPDVVMDFSYPANLDMILEDAVACGLPLVIGTTGLTDGQEAQIRAASAHIPIVYARNFSTGVTVLCRLVRMAAQALGEEFDIEIVETHHNKKEDAPSGTAISLLKSIDPEGSYPLVYGREGRPGVRGREIGMHSLRGGTVAGEHSVHFYGGMEEIELHHRADSREVFAHGALRAAAFAVDAKPGLYGMEDILFGGND